MLKGAFTVRLKIAVYLIGFLYFYAWKGVYPIQGKSTKTSSFDCVNCKIRKNQKF